MLRQLPKQLSSSMSSFNFYKINGIYSEIYWTYVVYLEFRKTFLIIKNTISLPPAISFRKRIHTDDSISRYVCMIETICHSFYTFLMRIPDPFNDWFMMLIFIDSTWIFKVLVRFYHSFIICFESPYYLA